MEFLAWHYSQGINYYMKSWISFMNSIIDYFSPFLLFKTLFSPWKRLVVVDRHPGFNFSRWFQTFSFNVISRFIGFFARLILILTSFIAVLIMVLSGAVGFLFWLIFPLFGYGVYLKFQRQPKQFMEKLIKKAVRNPNSELEVLLDNTAGRDVAQHIGISIAEMLSNAKSVPLDLQKQEFHGYYDLIKYLLDIEIWDKDFLQKNGIDKEDLLLTAQCWDDKKSQETQLQISGSVSQGLGLELLFGYTPVLSQYSTNLSTPFSFAHHLIAREDIVKQMERVLTAGSNVALIGPPGVGKKTVVMEFATRAMQGQFGSAMSFRRIYEFDYNSLLSTSKDLNEKKTLLAQVFEEAAIAGNIILMIKDIHRLTNPEVEGYDFTDIFEEYLGKKDLKIIALCTQQEFDRFIVPNLRLRKYLEKVEVKQPTKEEALLIAVEAAQNWEKKRKITIQMKTIRKIIDESDHYISETPFPEKALELLDAIVIYIEQQGRNVATIDDANAVLAEKTGISFSALTEDQEQKLGNIEEIIHERLINQESAVSAIARSLRARTIGVTSNDRPMGSFLFLGPTGVGKTETAKVLAKVYYGSEENILRFDMAEYAGSEGIERLMGSVTKNLPGLMTNAIRNRPASLLLLDEIEKSPPQIFNLFLSLLDEGVMTDAFGRKINCRHLFVIGTSNAGAEYIRELVEKDVKGEDLQKKVLDYVLHQGVFTPEFLNRFDGVIVYEPLTHEHLHKIAKLLLEELIGNLKNRGLFFDYQEDLIDKLADEGYDPAFGARPMRRLVNLILGDVIGKAILNKEISAGDKVTIVPLDGKERYKVQKVS